MVDALRLKRVYLNQIFQHHPDRNSYTGHSSSKQDHRAAALNDAYALLSKELKAGDINTLSYSGDRKANVTKPPKASHAPPPPVQYPQRTTALRSPHKGLRVEDFQPRRQPGHFWPGALPTRYLRLGQYLYYRCVISWECFMSALAWQISQRTPFGEVALGLGFLNKMQLKSIIALQLPGEQLGDCAARCMGLTLMQRQIVAAKQKALLTPLGQYFVQSGICNSLQLERYLSEHRWHNSN